MSNSPDLRQSVPGPSASTPAEITPGHERQEAAPDALGSAPFRISHEQQFQALLARFQDHTSLLRALTAQDLQILGGFLTVQLGLAAWLADHPIRSLVGRIGVAAVDASFAILAAVLLYNDYRRRREVRDSLVNTIEALRFQEVGAYIPGKRLDAPSPFRPWWWWYVVGIVIGAFAVGLILFAPPLGALPPKP